MPGSCRLVSIIKMSIFLKTEWFTYLKVSLKRDEYYIDMAKLPLQSF